MSRSLSSRLFALALFAAPVAFVSVSPIAHADPTATPAAAAAAAPVYTIDEAHTNASFAVRHLAISNVQGQFGKVSGTVSYDGKDTTSVKVDVTIDASSVDTRNAKRDGHLKTPDFFDVAKFPSITFKSKSATAVQNGKFKIVGDLTIHGVTKEVTLDADAPAAEMKHPMYPVHVIGTRATLVINRKDFGVGASTPALVVSEAVSITIDVEAQRPAGK